MFQSAKIHIFFYTTNFLLLFCILVIVNVLIESA